MISSKEIKVGPGLLACLHLSGFSLRSTLLSLRKACGGGRSKMKKNNYILFHFASKPEWLGYISPAL